MSESELFKDVHKSFVRLLNTKYGYMYCRKIRSYVWVEEEDELGIIFAILEEDLFDNLSDDDKVKFIFNIDIIESLHIRSYTGKIY